MTKAEFKIRWESNDDGGGITFDDIAKCAVEWGINSRPKISPISKVVYAVLKAAGTNDCEKYNPDIEEVEEYDEEYEHQQQLQGMPHSSQDFRS